MKKSPKYFSEYYRNWKDEADYQYLANKGWSYWAWEFLRRNNNYQKCHKIWLKKLKRWQDDNNKPHFFPVEKEGGQVAELAIRINESFNIEVSRPNEISKYCVVHPNVDSPPAFFSLIVYTADEKRKIEHTDKNKLLFEYDFNIPVNVFVQKIEKFLINYNKYTQMQLLNLNQPISKNTGKNRIQKSHLIELLRLLDARAMSADICEIRDILYKGISNDYPGRTADARIRDNTKRAVSLVNEDYKYLLFTCEK